MFLLNDKPISPDTAFTHEGISYPNNWIRLASPAERAAIGITEVADEDMSFDNRYYWSKGNPKALEDREESDEQGNPLYVKVLGEVNGERVMVDTTERLVTKGLKSVMIAQVKHTAGLMLAQSDWYVTRKVERDVAIPADVVAKRAAIVAESERLEAAIAVVSSVESLIEVLSAQQWPSEQAV
jgi:hypothetical protein